MLCDVDKVEDLEVYVVCVMMISLEGWKFGSLHIVRDVDKFGSLEVWKSTNLHVMCDDDKFERSEVYKFTHCV